MKLFNKDQQVILLMLGLTILFIDMFRPFHPFGSMLRASHTNLAIEPRHQWIVEVAGAVKNPGIYTFDMPPTVYQAIQSTGGSSVSECRLSFDRHAPSLRSSAVRQNPRPGGRGQGELSQNGKLPFRAAKLCRKAKPPPGRAGRLHSIADTLDSGMRIELQGWNAECAQIMITPMSYSKRLVLGIPIELNQASVDELAMIPGISHSLARRIIEFKESHGDFKTWNDLRCVKGVGPKKVECLRSYLNLKLPPKKNKAQTKNKLG